MSQGPGFSVITVGGSQGFSGPQRVADDQHPDHQHWIGRRPAGMAVNRSELPSSSHRPRKRSIPRRRCSLGTWSSRLNESNSCSCSPPWLHIIVHTPAPGSRKSTKPGRVFQHCRWRAAAADFAHSRAVRRRTVEHVCGAFRLGLATLPVSRADCPNVSAETGPRVFDSKLSEQLGRR